MTQDLPEEEIKATMDLLSLHEEKESKAVIDFLKSQE
jgi:hypothetical protein